MDEQGPKLKPDYIPDQGGYPKLSKDDLIGLKIELIAKAFLEQHGNMNSFPSLRSLDEYGDAGSKELRPIEDDPDPKDLVIEENRRPDRSENVGSAVVKRHTLWSRLKVLLRTIGNHLKCNTSH